MVLLPDHVKKDVQERFKALEGPVTILNFTQQLECQFCSETRQLLEEVASLSEKITLEVYNFQIDTEKVRQYSIDKIPATVILGEKDYGIRFFGIPSGYEFGSLVEAIVATSTDDSGLSEASREKLAALEDPVHIQVFVTPT